MTTPKVESLADDAHATESASRTSLLEFFGGDSGAAFPWWERDRFLSQLLLSDRSADTMVGAGRDGYPKPAPHHNANLIGG
jgi:hypothetical protein